MARSGPHPAAWCCALLLHAGLMAALLPTSQGEGAPGQTQAFGVVFSLPGDGAPAVEAGAAMEGDSAAPLPEALAAEETTPPAVPSLAQAPPEPAPPEPAPPEPGPPPEPAPRREPARAAPRPATPPPAAARPQPAARAPATRGSGSAVPSRGEVAPAGQAGPGSATAATATPASASRSASGALLPDSYRAGLSAALGRNLRYPALPRERGQEGEVVVQFSVTRSGAVRGARIMRSSGIAAFDAEALALLERVSPLPPLPRGWPAEEAMFAAPIRFTLR